MVAWWTRKRCGPIGVDIGSRAVKLVQLTEDRSDLHEAVRCELPAGDSVTPEARDEAIVQALVQARQGREFRGPEAVFCLSGRELFVQNIRVPQASGEDLRKIVHFEAASRLPFPSDQADVRFLEAGDIRQGETIRREVILMACRHAAVERVIALAERAKLVPVAIDVEPAALLRGHLKQQRRNADQEGRYLLVNMGAASSAVLIGRGDEILFIKYLELGGRRLDQSLAKHLSVSDAEAASLRRYNGERRADTVDPEIGRSLLDGCRPVLEQLAGEIAMCMRYYSVTFRGQPLSQIVIGGGEAQPQIVGWLSERLGLPCELSNPLRSYRTIPPGGRVSQWDVAAGLALRETS